ncbi:MAG: cobyric acid synthase, partial [Methyloligellaceae bacterium]
VSDPDGLEGPAGAVPGLGLLDIETILSARKRLERVDARHMATDTAVSGYEMHMGRTTGPDCDRPFLTIDGKPEGAVSADGRVMATYMHGLFGSDAFRSAFLAQLRPGAKARVAYDKTVDRTLDTLADHLEAVLDIDALARIAESRQSASQKTAATAPA